MRRRAGADLVDIDTFAGTCRFWYFEPREIDFEAIERAADDASYDLVGIELNIEGELVREAGQVFMIVLQTGQRFTVDGETDLEGRLHLHTLVTDWKTESARVTVQSGHASAAGDG